MHLVAIAVDGVAVVAVAADLMVLIVNVELLRFYEGSSLLFSVDSSLLFYEGSVMSQIYVDSSSHVLVSVDSSIWPR